MSSQSLLDANDPYERFIKDQNKNKNLIANDRSSKFSRKYKAFLQNLQTKKTLFMYGALQGFAIGCLAGFGIGLVSVYQTRRLAVIPLTMIGSGTFFAAVMAFGSLIRANQISDRSFDGLPVELREQFKIAQHIQYIQEKLKQKNPQL